MIWEGYGRTNTAKIVKGRMNAADRSIFIEHNIRLFLEALYL